jgi:hypothetical protein
MSTRRILLAILLALLLGAVGTYIAGEQVEVVVLRTVDADGTPHATKLWVVDHEDVPWVRVANPKRRWFQRLSQHPRADLVRHGATEPVDARPHDTARTREIIDRRFREKYGVVDWWYGVLLRRDAVPVRLDPVRVMDETRD